MPQHTDRLSLPMIQPSQAQKHVTHNEALRILDAVTQLVLQGLNLSTPPQAPSEGDVFAIGSAPTGDWHGQDGKLAQWSVNGWIFVAPLTGWLAWDASASRMIRYDGIQWSDALGGLDMLGINATADQTNRLTAASDATLLTHDGNGHQLKINKASANDTASLLYQSDWTGHAEMGLTGDNDFHIKTSLDGTTWVEALSFDAATGLPSGAAVQSNAQDFTEGRLARVDGVLAASRAFFGTYGSTSAQINIDTQNAGFIGLIHDNNPGTWPMASSGQFVWIETQRIFSGQAVIQTATYGYRSNGAPDDLRVFRRLRSNTSADWGAWREIYTSGSVLGQVSEAGGEPNGALMERGTNSNGSYVRYADGTQICWCSKASSDAQNVGYGALYRTPGQSLIFPASFATTTDLQVMPGHAGDSAAWFTADAPNTTSVFMRRVGVFNTALNVSYRCVAIGRWF